MHRRRAKWNIPDLLAWIFTKNGSRSQWRRAASVRTEGAHPGRACVLPLQAFRARSDRLPRESSRRAARPRLFTRLAFHDAYGSASRRDDKPLLRRHDLPLEGHELRGRSLPRVSWDVSRRLDDRRPQANHGNHDCDQSGGAGRNNPWRRLALRFPYNKGFGAGCEVKARTVT